MGGRRNSDKAQWELYNLADDLSETTNLASTHPKQLSELVKIWEEMNGEMAEPLF